MAESQRKIKPGVATAFIPLQLSFFFFWRDTAHTVGGFGKVSEGGVGVAPTALHSSACDRISGAPPHQLPITPPKTFT